MAEASAPALVAQELDRDLNRVAAATSSSKQVNDLTSMVVKKRKKDPESTTEKRKGDGSEIAGSPEKKIKVSESI